MLSRVITSVVLATFLVYAVGCTYYKEESVQTANIARVADEAIVAAIYLNGQQVEFDILGGEYDVSTRTIRGRTMTGAYIEVPIDELSAVRVHRLEQTKTAVVSALATLTVGLIVAAVVAAIALATKESCPFVYSFDGEKYVFDAEPLGGAVCRGLAKTDHSRLDSLRPVDGLYKLMLRNEVEETQYLDSMKLVVIDHAPSVEIVPDYTGTLQTIEVPTPPTAAWDETGLDLLPFVHARDGTQWQTRLQADDSWRAKELRHELTFQFSKPAGATSARLVVNVGTALWGSNMIREMLQLRGDRVDDWCAAVSRGDQELGELYQFIEREELYVLKLDVKEAGAWVERGMIWGGGPLITEDRILPVDLSHVTGDTVTVRLRPPVGFWTIDYLALEFGSSDPPQTTVATVVGAADHEGKDITQLLSSKDGESYVMPKVGDWAELTFNAPPQAPGTKRSIFLETFGYYEIQIDKSRPEQTALIRELLETEGMIVRYSMEEYVKWWTQQASSN